MAEIRFGPYLLERRIAVGGMAEVFLARRRDGRGQEPVVIKQILPQLAEDPELLQLFLDEARIASRVVHPGIVRVLDVGRENGVHYLVMEHVEGLDVYQLSRTLRESNAAFPADVAIRIGIDLSRALQHVHDARDSDGTPLDIVHRDVSPQNVLLSRAGEVKLTDFGIARARIRARRTRSGVLRGKMAYVAPEQFLGERGDRRVDVYAVGVVLFELFAGRRPFLGDDASILREVTMNGSPRLSTFVADIDPRLELLIARALERDPGARLGSAAQIADALEALAMAAPLSRVRTVVDACLLERDRKREVLLEAAARRRPTATVSVAKDVSSMDEDLVAPPPRHEILEETESDDETGLAHAVSVRLRVPFGGDEAGTVVSHARIRAASEESSGRVPLFDDEETIAASSIDLRNRMRLRPVSLREALSRDIPDLEAAARASSQPRALDAGPLLPPSSTGSDAPLARPSPQPHAANVARAEPAPSRAPSLTQVDTVADSASVESEARVRPASVTRVMPDVSVRRRTRRVRAFMLVLAVAVAFAGGFGYHWWRRHQVRTLESGLEPPLRSSF